MKLVITGSLGRIGGRYISVVPNPIAWLQGCLPAVLSSKQVGRPFLAYPSGSDRAPGGNLAENRRIAARTFPLAETATAHRYDEAGTGRIVLLVS